MKKINVTKQNLVETLIRLAYGHSAFTNIWLQNPNNKDKGTIQFLEDDLQSFIEKHKYLIDEIII